MEFEWDESKNQSNIKKHGICFEDAKTIFDSFTLDAIDDRFDYGEERVITLGKSKDDIYILVVVHTDRQGKCRIISARKANEKERLRYEEAL